MFPKQIKSGPGERLSLHWSDGHTGFTTFKNLRDACPCAGCQGETVLLKTYTPPPQPELPGKYVLKSAQQVGSYALQITWGDGHATGLYTWEKLRSLCECDECRG